MEKNEVLQELKALDSRLAGFPRGMPYAVPEGYFESLADGALSTAKAAGVPAGYFQNLPQAMLAAAKASDVSMLPAKPKARVIAFPMRRWAAAAVLLMSFGIGAVLLFDQPSQSDAALASLPTDAVQEYASAHFYELTATVSPTSPSPDLSGLSKMDLEAYATEEGLLF